MTVALTCRLRRLLWLDGRVNLDSSNAPISTLQLYYSTPVVLSANTFTNFNSLTYLSLRDASSMEDHALAGLPSLFELVLTGSLTSVAAAVQGVSTLTKICPEGNLVIQTSRITSISSNAFAALTSLTSLTLNSNPITSIHADAFAGITRLQALSLQNTPLTTLPPGLLYGLSSLNVANFVSNNFSFGGNTVAPPSTFGNVGNPQTFMASASSDSASVASITSVSYMKIANSVASAVSVSTNSIASAESVASVKSAASVSVSSASIQSSISAKSAVSARSIASIKSVTTAQPVTSAATDISAGSGSVASATSSLSTMSVSATRNVAASNAPTGDDESLSVLPIIVGALGGVLLLALIAIGILIRRHRASRPTNQPASQDLHVKLNNPVYDQKPSTDSLWYSGVVTPSSNDASTGSVYETIPPVDKTYAELSLASGTSPRPFTRVDVVYAEPLVTPTNTND
ncbi:hypothetical protein CAOG_03026 [Capsaspora owczarzaki ATCC 30864]|uniref:Uncharacterized protein n=1 Tax=Capsaspora owczarzaki (strain ATCC 30864) TaxID=595528 RepID=A0A0D2X258_CAPO3|nr:hypothetical protein CAOG_03026 [Capsaspora owczarzaki ATCC 30864]KJE91984.1 hypothetical protein CAOG_003026 [Capsaspora owczarzaki ATCC 30864]|eukprot:XP_004363865.1 hypothetical protein CAOG_03026 [Capsaspora owczarzaki ATCC 30864]